MRSILPWLALLLGIAAAGCAANPPPMLTEAGRGVHVETRYDAVLQCKSLGMILGRAASLMGDIASEQETDARNRAGAMGGNRIIARQTSMVTEPLTRQY